MFVLFDSLDKNPLRGSYQSLDDARKSAMKRKSPSVYVCVMQVDGSADAVGSVINSNSHGFPIYSSGGCEYALNQNGSLGRKL